ncbi:hypothetical protein GJ496_001498 [Pomphorhynchus laevis]|nr:hypothetical protein GJ496_001498 [Pomphorhynchus laevis]
MDDAYPHQTDNANDEVLTSSQSSSNPSDDLDNADQNENSDDSDDDSSSRDSDDNLHPSSDNESNADFETEAEHKRKATTYISCKEELIRIRLSRHKLAKWCHAPFFREVALGSFVRVGVGIANSDPVYRIAEIVDISTLNKPYEFEGTKTDKGVKLRHSNSERLFRMSFISNSTFTDREFDRWVYTLRKQNQTLPTIEQMELKESIIKHYMQLKIRPTNFAVARTDLRAQLDVAIANKNNYEIERLENELQELDKQSAELRKDEQLARLDEINKRNRQSTLDNVEAALMLYAEEKKDAKPDPFTRRRCLPQIVTKSKNQNSLQKHEISTTSTDTLDIASLQNKCDDLSAVSVLTPNDTVIPENYDTSDIDLFSMHNFDVDITIPQFEDSIIQQPTAVNGHFTFQNIYSTVEASTQQKSLDITNNQAMDTTIDGQATIKKPLNLDEYRRRRVSVAHTGALDCDNSEVTYERRSESSVLFPRNTASNATSHNSVLIINDDIYPYPKNKASNSTGQDSVLFTHYNVSQNAIGNNSVRSSVPPSVLITRANKARQLNDDKSCYVIISGLLKS